MADPATPDTGTEMKAADWKRDEKGNLWLDGVLVEPGHGYSENAEEDEEKKPETPPAEAKPVEQEAPKEPEPPPPPEPPKVEQPEKRKFQLKVQGEVVERELTPDEIIARLQMAEDYQKKTTELAEQRRKIEPYMPILEKPEFKEWIAQQVEAGVIEAPAKPPPPAPEDVVGFRLRQQDPDFDEIRSSMVEWAATLPSHEADILNNNHRAFNETYDRFKAARSARVKEQAPPEPPKAPPPPPDPKVIAKNIQAKEVSKEQARVETPGGQPQEVDPKREWRKVDRELKRAVREGQRLVYYQGQQVEPDVAWILHRQREPE